MKNNAGLYIHVPFCSKGKCNYCDFYSLPFDEGLKKAYIEAVMRSAAGWALGIKDEVFDTVYFGGGTPSLLGDGLAELLSFFKDHFNITKDAEVTFEANPADNLYDTLALTRQAGFNRLSLGMQSANETELKLLGRRHRPWDTIKAMADAKRAGYENISLDLMLCLPEQSVDSMQESIDAAASLEPTHLSAYILKLEEGTPLYKNKDKLNLPDDDTQSEYYIKACEAIEKHGFMQYEISNFAQKGMESRHNLKYWNCDSYLGLGPAAHSYLNGLRFYYNDDLDFFIKYGLVVDDGEGGDLDEYIMLRLRLVDGIVKKDFQERYNCDFSIFDENTINKLSKGGLIDINEDRLRLTRMGLIVSNAVIAELISY